jgi:hypothetical protein
MFHYWRRGLGGFEGQPVEFVEDGPLDRFGDEHVEVGQDFRFASGAERGIVREGQEDVELVGLGNETLGGLADQIDLRTIGQVGPGGGGGKELELVTLGDQGAGGVDLGHDGLSFDHGLRTMGTSGPGFARIATEGDDTTGDDKGQNRQNRQSNPGFHRRFSCFHSVMELHTDLCVKKTLCRPSRRVNR